MNKRAFMVVCGLALTRQALAAEPLDTTDIEGLLDESVVSSVSLTSEAALSAPATTTTVTAEELRRYGIRSLDQAINFLSLGMITENPLSAVDVGARGVLLTSDYGAHMLLLVDGHTMNEPWDGTAYFDRSAAVPLELIDHIEMVLGPGSVLYGSHAMLGVINVITKQAKDYKGIHLIAESELPTLGRGGLGFGAQFTALGVPGSVTGQVDYSRSVGPRFTYGPQDYGTDTVTSEPKRFSFTDEPDGIWGGKARAGLFSEIPAAYGRVAWGDFTLALRAAQSTRGVPFYSAANFNDPKSFERDRWLQLDARYDATLSALAGLSLRLYGDLYDYREDLLSAAAEDCLEGEDAGCLWKALGGSRWGGAEARTRLDWLANGRLVTVLGADGRTRSISAHNEYHDVRGGDAAITNKYAQNEFAGALYAEQTAHPLSWLDLNAGVRLDDDQGYGTHWSPRAAAVISPWAGNYIKLVYAEAFRAPSAYERFFADPTSTVAAPDLRPETVRSVEASIEQRIGTHRVLVDAFRSRWSALVMENVLSQEETQAAIDRGELLDFVVDPIQYANVGMVENYGIDATYMGSALGRRLQYAFSVTAAHARRYGADETCSNSLHNLLQGCGGGDSLPAAASLFGNARISYELGDRLPTLALATRFVGKRLLSGTSFADVPSAEPQVELRAALTGVLPGVSGLSYRLIANYAFSAQTPYGIGPVNATEPTADFPRQETAPVDRFRVMAGLQYDLEL
jgi:outer membrane receptor for ferrienterochelin and colicins